MTSRIVNSRVKETLTDDFSARVRQLRQAANLTQPALARILGLSTSYLSLIESGERTNPTIETVDRISTFFGVAREWLLDGTGPMFLTGDPAGARERYFQLLESKLGPDAEQELREQKVIAEISARLAQAVHCDASTWAEYRRQIIEAVDSYAAHCRAHGDEFRQARLQVARAAARTKRSK
jgi:transcriptional regulator with XRE-family HTH domain